MGRRDPRVDAALAKHKKARMMFASIFGQPTVFVDPRRAMVSARVNLGR